MKYMKLNKPFLKIKYSLSLKMQNPFFQHGVGKAYSDSRMSPVWTSIKAVQQSTSKHENDLPSRNMGLINTIRFDVTKNENVEAARGNSQITLLRNSAHRTSSNSSRRNRKK